MMRGRRPAAILRTPDRKAVQFYVRPESHLLARLVAQQRGVTMGGLLDELIAAEAARHGIDLGKTS